MEQVEEITQEIKFWTTWEGLQNIFNHTETEVVCAFYEWLYIKGDPKCWSVEWSRNTTNDLFNQGQNLQ